MLGKLVRMMQLEALGHSTFNEPPWDEMPEGHTKETCRRIGEVMFDRGAEVTYVRREEEERIRAEGRLEGLREALAQARRATPFFGECIDRIAALIRERTGQ